MIVRFVDIDGIVDYHCVFLFKDYGSDKQRVSI
jgi:hypothetical protein